MRPCSIEFEYNESLIGKTITVMDDGEGLRFSFTMLAITQNKVLRGKKAVSWMDRFDALPLAQWKRHWELPYSVLDGSFWSLRLKEKGKKARKWDGVILAPPFWEAFLFLFDEVFPQAELFPPGSIDRLDIDYRGRGHEESLSLDVLSLSLAYSRTQGLESESHSFLCREEVRDALSLLSGVLGKIQGGDGPLGGPQVRIGVFPHRGKRYVIQSPYDRLFLPEEWNDVMDCLLPLGIGNSDIMDSSVYRHGAREGELVYIGVRFSKGGDLYHYRINGDYLYVGDWIIVPVGNEGGEKALVVETVGYYLPGTEPFPYELTKEVIGKTESEPHLVPCPLLDGEKLSRITCDRVRGFFLGKEGNVPSWVYGISYRKGKKTCLSCLRCTG